MNQFFDQTAKGPYSSIEDMKWDLCLNCGHDRGDHLFGSYHCPSEKKWEWRSTTFLDKETVEFYEELKKSQNKELAQKP